MVKLTKFQRKWLKRWSEESCKVATDSEEEYEKCVEKNMKDPEMRRAAKTFTKEMRKLVTS